MKLGPIVLRLRLANTRFGNFIGGSAEMALAMQQTLTRDMAFVIPLADNAAENMYDAGINQKIYERFGVIVALKNDTDNLDQLGLTAYDQLDDVRNELFGAILGLDMGGTTESSIYYRGGRILDITRAYMWFQFEFEFRSRLISDPNIQPALAGLAPRVVDDTDEPRDWLSIYSQYILAPSVKLPITDGIPVSNPDAEQYIDMSKDPFGGPYSFSFGTGFDFYDEH